MSTPTPTYVVHCRSARDPRVTERRRFGNLPDAIRFATDRQVALRRMGKLAEARLVAIQTEERRSPYPHLSAR